MRIRILRTNPPGRGGGEVGYLLRIGSFVDIGRIGELVGSLMGTLGRGGGE